MAVPRDLTNQIRRLDQYDLRRLLILIRGLLIEVDGLPTRDDPDVAAAGLDGVTYQQEMVRCGKETCSTCPHGPYWYAYWKEDGRTRSRYIGRHLPGQPVEPVVPDLV